MKYAAISFNFDSLGWSYGFPENYKDPCFTSIQDRYFHFSEKYDFRYSFYLIGKDLLKYENRSAIRSWSESGHEIGNHSWSHYVNLGSLPIETIYSEINKSHNIIKRIIGKEPKGFISPAWNSSSNLLKVLIELNYSYDTSTFPSWLMIPATLKSVYNKLGHKNALNPLLRKDYFVNLFGPTKPYLKSNKISHNKRNDSHEILILPQPTNNLRIACWHTIGYMFGWKFHFRLLEECLRSSDTFYYLIHPADFLVDSDLNYKGKTFLDRLNHGLDFKMEKLDNAFKMINDSGRKIVTMEELAKIKSEELRKKG